MLDFTRGENVNLCWAPKGLAEKNNFTVRQIDFYAGLERHRLVSISEREWRRKNVRHQRIILIIRKEKFSPNSFNETSFSTHLMKTVILRTHKRTKCNSFSDAARGAICWSVQ
jgi:hypothetical protein